VTDGWWAALYVGLILLGALLLALGWL